MRNIFGDQGNMEQNFWEQGNSVKVNFGEHLNNYLCLRNKGTTINFHREQGNMHPPPWGALTVRQEAKLRGQLLVHYPPIYQPLASMTLCCPILSVIILLINKSDSRDFVNHSYDYRPSWTSLSRTINLCNFS